MFCIRSAILQTLICSQKLNKLIDMILRFRILQHKKWSTTHSKPYLRICLAASYFHKAHLAKTFAHPSVHREWIRTLSQSSRMRIRCVPCIGSTAIGYWNNPFADNTMACCNCWDCTDYIDCARSYRTHGSAHRKVDYERKPVEWLEAMVLSWWKSSSLMASSCHRSVPIWS